MRRSLVVRALTLALAFVHTFPARKHLVAFVAEPSWAEGYKGFGAAFAIALYLLPVAVQCRALTFLWRERRTWLRLGGLALAVVHLVPAIDHLPAFVGAPSWGDAWRGLGSGLAVAWFLAPLPLQARVLSFVGRVTRLSPVPAPAVSLQRAARDPFGVVGR